MRLKIVAFEIETTVVGLTGRFAVEVSSTSELSSTVQLSSFTFNIIYELFLNFIFIMKHFASNI